MTPPPAWSAAQSHSEGMVSGVNTLLAGHESANKPAGMAVK